MGEGAEDEWEAKERAVLRRSWLRSVDRDNIRTMIGDDTAEGIGKRGALAAPCCCFVTPLYFIGNLNLFNKNDLLKDFF